MFLKFSVLGFVFECVIKKIGDAYFFVKIGSFVNSSILDDIDFGGPSPITAAFMLSTGCILNSASRLIYELFATVLYSIFCFYFFYFDLIILGRSHTIGAFHINPRLVLISDGRPTDFTSISSDDNSAIKSDEVTITIV